MAALAQLFGVAEEMVLTVFGVFTRVAAIAFLLPGMGERTVPVRLRLGIALSLTLILAPILRPLVPETPGDLPGLVRLVAAEALAGTIIGLGLRVMIFALQIAGTAAASLMSIQHMFGSGVAPDPEPTIATMLALGGIVLAMNAGLHVALIGNLAGLYGPLPFGQWPAGSEVAEWSVARMAEAFAFGITLAFPFVAISTAYNIALGALSRAMPQLMVVLIGVPVLVGLGMITLWLSIPEIFTVWEARLARLFANPLGGVF